uniref:Uncharacterized protein n=1 Tax=Rhizobium loti TaxID=381 RepID=M5AMW7_RHILI|nr:conserved hypothetical protein [Mesorhizobium loti NZP2037]
MRCTGQTTKLKLISVFPPTGGNAAPSNFVRWTKAGTSPRARRRKCGSALGCRVAAALVVRRLQGSGPARQQGQGDHRVARKSRARGALPLRAQFHHRSGGACTRPPGGGESPRRFRQAVAGVSGRQGTGTHVQLTWQVTVLRPILKLLAPLLRPAFAWNHRWTRPCGEAGLRRYLIEKKSRST